MPYASTHNETPANPDYMGALVCFDQYVRGLNRSRTWGWRIRKDGLVRTQNVFGKLYITRDEIARFEGRAMSGDFHQDIKPRRAA